MLRTFFLLLGLVCGLFTLAGSASAAKRVALVVGIDKYDNLNSTQQLKKAVNDARTLGEALKGLGYDVIAAENPDRRGFNESWQKFLNSVEPGDEAAFFFAGHGIEIAGQNYLLPRDVPKPQSGESSLVKNESLSVTQLLVELQNESPRVSLIILDACRDNPFAMSGVRSLGGTRGLARVEAPEGTFVMYSAGTGQAALDRLSDSDDNANSVFTRSLVPLIKTPGLGVQEVALRVRRQVVALAKSVGHKQTPSYYDQVIGRFCPAGCQQKVAAQTPKATPQPPAPKPPEDDAAGAGKAPALAPAVEEKKQQLAAETPPSEGTTNRAWLGVIIQNVGDDIAESLGLAEASGALVTKVTENGPAARGDIKPGDVIVAVKGDKVADSRDLARKIAALPSNSNVKISVMRDAAKRDADVILGHISEAELAAAAKSAIELEATRTPPKGKPVTFLGMTLAAGSSGGLEVTKVDSESVAAEKGVKSGDVLLQAMGGSLADTQDLASAADAVNAKGRKAILLKLKTGDALRFVALPMDGETVKPAE